MPYMIGNRDDVVRTTAGHTVAFKAGEETFVPDITAVVKACHERGHVLKKDTPAPAPAAPAKEQKAAVKGE